MKRIGRYLISILIIVCVIYIGVINYNACKSKFFDATFIDVLNLIFVAFFTYFLVEIKSDERKKKENIENLISKLYLILDDSKFYNISGQDQLTELRIIQRSVRSKIQILINLNFRSIEKDLEYINQEFDEYWNCVSENVDNIIKLKGISQTLYRHINNIENRLDEMILKLY